MLPSRRLGLCLIPAILLPSIADTMASAQEPTLLAYTQVRNAANITLDENGNSAPNDIGTLLLDAMMAESGLEYEIEIAPWARMIQYLDTRPNTLPILSFELEREDIYHWIGLVTEIESHLYELKERAGELPRTIGCAQLSRR